MSSKVTFFLHAFNALTFVLAYCLQGISKFKQIMYGIYVAGK